MDDDLRDFIDYSNVILLLFFTVELFVKIIGLNKGFLYDKFNLFDLVVVVAGWVEIFVVANSEGAEGAFGGGSTATTLRSVRVLRFFRLASTWKAMGEVRSFALIAAGL